ncbi:Neopullulanase 2 [Pirellulimonas nuda]|uniref:Neopullulanase 2 n=2 Tax=Pirellulimonas nuda TaxID=2528009 RepID=A0A518DFJ3_9BACT|nr:Neopullulanase 2 [Pirellulimonas nuda]
MQTSRCVLAAAALLTLGCGEPAAEAPRKATPTAARPSDAPPGAEPTDPLDPAVPAWAEGVVFYQLFPERFRNGDPSNDPTHASLEFPDVIPGPDSDTPWSVTPWTSDWYARADWEQALGDNFYENGVFHRRYGGDLQGVLDKLDYLMEMGVGAIYFNPVFHARSLHKYDGASYHHVDPYFGPDPDGDLAIIAQETSDPATWRWTAADELFKKIIVEAHRRKMWVIVDGVFNHTGRDFFAFADLREKQQQSPYVDWYIVEAFDDPTTEPNEFRYKGWWGVDTLPEFADTADGKDLHPGPKRYVFDATRRWMDPDGDGDPDDGIDGWRLDVAAEVPIGFWRDWNALVRQLNPQAYTVAEFWDDGSADFLAEGGFSATMNYHGFAFPVKGFFIDGVLPASEFTEQIETRRAGHPPRRQLALQNLIDSHDTDRVGSMIVNASADRPYLRPDRFDYDVSERVSPRNWSEYNVRKPTEQELALQRLITLFQMTYVGAPMIYYGDEAGMWGADDPGDRKPMLWEDLRYDDEGADPLGRPREPDQVAVDLKLQAFYAAACKLRAGYEALRRGDIEVVATDDQHSAFAFRRTLGDHQLIATFNRGDKPWKLVLPTPAGSWLVEVFTASGSPETVSLKQTSDNAWELVTPPRDGVVVRQVGGS